jgi:iron(III) transport system substrate-binding protein
MEETMKLHDYVLFAAVMGLAVSSAQAQLTPEIRAQAKKEGRIVLWSATGGEYLETVKREAAKQLGLKVEAQRFTTFTLVERAMKEFDANIHEIDVITIGALDPVADMRKRGMIVPFTPSSLDKYRSPELYDPEHYWHTHAMYPSTIIYNPAVIKGDMVPRTWKDLTEPRYKDQLIMGSPVTSSVRAFSYLWWQQMGPGFFDGLKRNNVQIVSSNQTAVPLLVRGERPIMLGDFFVFMLAHQQGVPVAQIAPKEGVLALVGPAMVMAKAPRPAAARVFLDWFLSPAGQGSWSDSGALSPLRDEKIRYPAILGDYDNLKYQIVHPDTINEWWRKEGRQKITEVFGGG